MNDSTTKNTDGRWHATVIPSPHRSKARKTWLEATIHDRVKNRVRMVVDAPNVRILRGHVLSRFPSCTGLPEDPDEAR